MNKRKPDDEFARIDLSYFNSTGDEVVVFCPESKDAAATLHPVRRRLNSKDSKTDEGANDVGTVSPTHVNPAKQTATTTPVVPQVEPDRPIASLKEQHFTIMYGDTGYSYESIIGPYLDGAKSVLVEDPYIRLPHQIQNFVRLCETLLKAGSVRKIELITGYDDDAQWAEVSDKLEELKQSLLDLDVVLDVQVKPNLHDREIRLDNGWVIKIGRGLDFYQRPNGWFEIGVNDMTLRKCLETKVDIFREMSA
jgi:ATP-dependent Lon protease